MKHMEKKTAVTNRLKRLNGQVTALVTLIEADADCDKIFVQFQAAKAALSGAFAELLKMHLTACAQKNDRKSLEHIIDLMTKK